MTDEYTPTLADAILHYANESGAETEEDYQQIAHELNAIVAAGINTYISSHAEQQGISPKDLAAYVASNGGVESVLSESFGRARAATPGHDAIGAAVASTMDAIRKNR